MKKVKGQKKIYSKPELEVVTVDHEISLVMASVPDSDIDPFSAAPETTIESASPVQTYTSSSENDPFGSSSPDYGN